MIKIKNQKVLWANFYGYRSYMGKSGRGFFPPRLPILNRVKVNLREKVIGGSFPHASPFLIGLKLIYL